MGRLMAGRKTFLPSGERARLALNLALRGYSSRQVADELGVTPRTAMNLVRTGKIRAGTYVPLKGRPGPHPHEDDQEDGTGCTVCGLHGEHVCLTGRADDRRWAAG